ncbi:hypothetical protein [Miniphocaeibacter massiliensis]|uniref:hypothetical protein n=1 Tax=Miniphocaeibacter massiliensis TaxID=2041841 RepID=UPI000C1B97B0|nr:hypothetical protein [Miniphocaeibacter massiliensis]
MKIDQNNIMAIVDSAKNFMQDKLIVIIYNSIGFTKKIDSSQEDTDFFSNQEIGEIFDALIQENIKILPYNNEMDFINSVTNNIIETNNIIVWNLSRQGTYNNQKSLITSFCDFNKIPYIGSSVYSMNLSRHKLHFQKILKSLNLCDIPSYSINEFKNTNIIDGNFILKKAKGSASRGIKEETSNICYTKMKNYINENNISKDYIIQKYIKGYEIEVPLLQIDGKFVPFGISGIKINNLKYFSNQIMPEEMFDSNYSFYNFEYFAINQLNFINCNFIYSSAVKIAEILELKDYCRIDFRIDSQYNLYCFDISTTPYLTKHSSPNFLFETVNLNHSDLLLSIIGAFSSNTDNH